MSSIPIPNGRKERVTGWGRYPMVETRLVRPASDAELSVVTSSDGLVARGNGRGYGDCAVGKDASVQTLALDRFESFDPETGIVVAQAGVLLETIIDVFLPRGWFPYVTPGTKFVTLGGMAAADVHGKNHHVDGTIRRWVEWFDLVCADGIVRRCSRTENNELFEATIGGMGLTGLISRIAVRLRKVQSAYIQQQTFVAPNLAAAMELFDRHETATYSVAWIDCLAVGEAMGRSIVMLGEHATITDLPNDLQDDPFDFPRHKALGVPFAPPISPLNRLSIQAFNSLYYAAQKRKIGQSLSDYDSYFYPLDSIRDWNRIYGRRGFVQHQCVLPEERSREGLLELLQFISRHTQGSFLAVLKKFGKEEGPWSFPMAGYSLALDFPVNSNIESAYAALNEIVLRHAGRLYLAKDALMGRDFAHGSDHRLANFKRFREQHGMKQKFASVLSERIDL